jgi:hypothetical protein
VARACGYPARVRRGVISLVVLLTLLATTAATASPAAEPLSVSKRVLRANELRGFRPFGPPTVFIRPRGWISSDTGLTRGAVTARAARLTKRGFVTLVSQNLAPIRGSFNRGGVSWVMRLGSAASARAELSSIREYSKTDGMRRGRSYKAFRVTGIPRAIGFRLTSPGQISDNVVFADGPFIYSITARWEEYARNPPSRAAIVAGARKLYKRVHGRPPA